MQYIFYGGIIILAIIGISDIVCYMKKRGYKKQDDVKIIVLPLKGNVPNIEYIVKRILAKESLYDNVQVQLYIIDLGVEPETSEILDIIQNTYSSVFVCKK